MKKVLSCIAAGAVMLSLAGCLKNDAENIPAGRARVMVVHASPGAGGVDVTANGSLVKSNLVYPGNTGYFETTSGGFNLKVAPTGTTNYVIDGNANLDINRSYSVFAVDTGTAIKGAIVLDDTTAPAAGKAHIRFLHFSRTAPAVDVFNGTTVLFSNRSFNDQATNSTFQSYTVVDAGTINLQVRLAGTNTVAVAATPVTLQAGKIYTVFAKGLTGGTGANALGIEVIGNNP